VLPAAAAGDVASPSTCTSQSHLFYYAFLTFALEDIRSSYLTANSLENLFYTEDKRKGAIPAQLDGKYVGYSESKYRLRISLAHPLDCHIAHVQ